MKDIKCPICNKIQYAPMDKKYVELYEQCWSCDKEKWMKDLLSLEEFEKREEIALQACLTTPNKSGEKP